MGEFLWEEEDDWYERNSDKDPDIRIDKYRNTYDMKPDETIRGRCPRCGSDIYETDFILWLHHQSDASHKYDSVLCEKCADSTDTEWLEKLGYEIDETYGEEIDPDLPYDFVEDTRYIEFD